MTVLVLSEDTDPTVDRVVDGLNTRGVPVFRCDTSWFPSRLSLDAQLRDGRWTGLLTTSHREVKLAGLRSVWYRRPTNFTFPGELSEPERKHATWEAKIGLGGILATLPVLWCNHPAREADACYKPHQLAVAAQCGLPVPHTLVTSKPDAVRKFAAQLGGEIVVKPLALGWIGEEGGMKATYTHALTIEELADLRGVEATAHLFQERVQKSYEVRLTVVGDRLFPASIHAHTEAAALDWRSDPSSVSYSVVEPPAAIVHGVRSYMRTFGLCFAAFDFAVTHAGQWIFFEANAGGQFGFVEAHTGLDISTALAELLTKGML